jgi:hypothetical protein
MWQSTQPWAPPAATHARHSLPVDCIGTAVAVVTPSSVTGTGNSWQPRHRSPLANAGSAVTRCAATPETSAASTSPPRQWQAAQSIPSAARGSGARSTPPGDVGEPGASEVYHPRFTSTSARWSGRGAWQFTQNSSGSTTNPASIRSFVHAVAWPDDRHSRASWGWQAAQARALGGGPPKSSGA